MVEHIKEVLRESVNRKNPSYARNNLTEEEKAYFFNNLDFFLKFSNEENFNRDSVLNIISEMSTQEEAMKRLKNIQEMNQMQKFIIINNLPNDKLKTENLPLLDDEDSKFKIICNMVDDGEKIKVLPLLNDIDRYVIMYGMTDDEQIKKGIPLIENEKHKAEIIQRLGTDKLKYETIDNLKEDKYITDVVTGLSFEYQYHYLLKILKTDNKNELIYQILLGIPQEEKTKIFSLLENREKEVMVMNLSNNEEKKFFIDLLNEESKLKVLKKMSNDEERILVFNSISSPNTKIENLPLLENEESKSMVIQSLSTDDEKIKGLNFLKRNSEKFNVINTLSTDDKKIEGLSHLEGDFDKVKVIKKLSNDRKKLDSLPLLTDETQRSEVIETFSIDRMKIEALKFLNSDWEKVKIIKELTIGDKKQNLSQLKNDKAKTEIILTFPGEDEKIEELSILQDDYAKLLVIYSLSPDEKFNHLMEIKKAENRLILIKSMNEEYKIKALNKEYGLIFKKNFSNNLNNKYSDLQPMNENLLAEIVISLTDIEQKVKLLPYFKENNVLSIVYSLKTETQKLEALKYISSNTIKLEILSQLSPKNITSGLDDLTWFSNEEDKGYSKKLKIIEEYQKMLEEKNDYQKNAFVNYIENHHENLEESSISQITNILSRFSKSNSLELSNLKEQLTPLVLSTQNPIESFNKIEKIFLKNNIPMFGKEFLCFQSLYPEFQKREGNKETFDFTEGSRISPELLYPTQTRKMKAVSKNATDKDIRFQIVFNDLLRIASRSNNRSLIEYLNNIEYGNTLFLGISKGIITFNDLDDKAKQILDVFSNHLAALYENTEKGSEEIFENLSTVEKITYFSQKFSPTSRYDLPDRIVRSFAYQAGIESFEQFKNIVINSVREKEEVSKKRSEELKNGKKLVLEPGDFVRGIGNIDCVESSLNNGNVCKEFLGTFLGESKSDTTPLDVDLTLITPKNTDIYHNIVNTPTGFGFGNIYVILKKDNPNLNITRDKEGNLTGKEYDPTKVEVFGTNTQKVGYETHWGARTGIASSDIDYILFKEDLTIDSSNPYSEDGKVNYILPESEFEKKEYYGKHQNDLAILKNEVVKNGFYIPIVDFSGKIIFTDEEYQELKQKMEGLSHYGSKEYHLKQHQYSDYTEKIKGLLASNKQETKIQSQKVYQALSDIIQSIPIDENSTKTLQAKNKIGIDLTPGSVEVLETGSSVRGTNVPYDFDFDYIFRLDSNMINDDKKMHQFRTKICEALNIASVPSDEFRDVEATIPGLGTIKLDITFIQKNDKVEYSTEMALQDRMDTIYKSNPAVGDEVTANIILAKLLLKQAGCYKPERKDPNQGGLGGVGIENWITQNGGTLETAANSFLKASEGKTYEEFKLIYHIHDYGKNHLYKEKKTYPYDDFVFNNMNRIGYQKMQEVLRKYIRYLSGEKDLFPELEEVLNALEQQQEKEVTTTHSRGIVSFFILISLSLFVSIITIVYIFLRK